MLIVVLAAAYFVPRGPMWNADTRIFLTASIVDRGQLNIDPFAVFTGDVASYRGHYYSDKAPGLSLLAVPVYAVVKYSLLAGKPYRSLFNVPADQRVDFLPRYLLALVFAGLPTGLLAALLYSFLARLGVRRPWRALLALTYGLGTIALPFASVFFGHQLAAALLFGAFVLLLRLRRGELAPRYHALAGLLMGYAVITEYPTLIIAAGLAVYALTRPGSRRRAAALLALGAAPALAVAAIYNTLAFGSPLSQGYAHLAGPATFQSGQAQGLMGVTYPHLDAIWQTTFGPYRGLFLLSPVLLLAVPGFVLLARRREWRAETVLWAAIASSYFVFMVSYFEWDGGFSLGPRHFLPALPFLVAPIGELLRPEHARAWRIATATLGAVSMAIVGLATATVPLIDPRFDAPLTEWVLPSLLGLSPDPTHPAAAVPRSPLTVFGAAPFFTHAQLDNNWGMLIGLPGAMQLLPLLASILVVLVWRAWSASRVRAAAVEAPAAAQAVVATVDEPVTQLSESSAAARPAPDTAHQLPAISIKHISRPLGVGAASGQGRVAIVAPAKSTAWEDAILAIARQRGDEPPRRIQQALLAVKLALVHIQQVYFFRRIRSIVLYGSLARGEDPFREVNILILCEALKGPHAMEHAFEELSQLTAQVREQTGTTIHTLLVVRGQSERQVPGEPSWRDLAVRGMLIYGDNV